MFHDMLFKQLIQSDFPAFIRLFFPDVFRQVDFTALKWFDKEHFTEAAFAATMPRSSSP